MVEFLYLFQFSLSIEFSPCQIPYNCEMSASRALRPYVIRFVSSLQPNGSKRCRYRTMATATMDTPTLPLAGIRVLDMTRVLAGVRFNTRDSRPKRTDSVPAILYANPRRPRVSRNLQYDIPPILVEWSGIRYKMLRTEFSSAEVIKIEHPVRGDDTRAWGPPYAKHIRGDKTDSPGESAYFLSVSSSVIQRRLRLIKDAGEQEQKVPRSLLPTTLRCYDLA